MNHSITKLLTSYHLGSLESRDVQIVEDLLLSSTPALNEYFFIKREFDHFNEQIEVPNHIKASISGQIFEAKNQWSISNILSFKKGFYPVFALATTCLVLILFFGNNHLKQSTSQQPKGLNTLTIDAANNTSVSLNVL